MGRASEVRPKQETATANGSRSEWILIDISERIAISLMSGRVEAEGNRQSRTRPAASIRVGMTVTKASFSVLCEYLKS